MSDLIKKHCKPCEGGVAPLDLELVRDYMRSLDPGWALAADGKSIAREFGFKNYYETMAFVNAVAWIAHGEDHHPDMDVGYNRCRVLYTTHAIGGLSENDLICAAKVDALLEQ